MSGDSRRLAVVLALFLLALIAMGVLYGRDWLQGRSSPGSDYAFVTDIDRWRRTDRERIIEARYDFTLSPRLQELPLTVGAWEGVDVPQTNLEVQILLEPEQYVYRRYTRADGKYVWLSVIGSRQAKSFHSPQICYDADGWQTDMTSQPVELEQGAFYALQLAAQKEQWEHVVLYFYLYPNAMRDAADGMVLFKVTAPLEGSLQETLEIEKAFIREFFHGVRT